MRALPSPVLFALAFVVGTAACTESVSTPPEAPARLIPPKEDAGFGATELDGGEVGARSTAGRFHVGVAPFRVAVGDFDGDGAKDVAVLNGGQDFVFRSTGPVGDVTLVLREDGGYRRLWPRFVRAVPNTLEVADLDGDGRDEALAGARNDLSVLRVEDGGARVAHAFRDSSRGLAIGVSGGAVHYLGERNETIRADWPTFARLLPSDDGGFAASPLTVTGSQEDPRFAAHEGCFAAAATELNGDGVPDFAHVHWDYLELLLSDAGTGHFDAVPLDAGFGAARPRFFDVDLDGAQDLVAIAYDGLHVLFGPGFSRSASLGVDAGLDDVSFGRFHRGSGPTLALSVPSRNQILFVALGDTGLEELASLTTGRGPRGLARADLDGDGVDELFVAESGENEVAIYAGGEGVPPGNPLRFGAPSGCALDVTPAASWPFGPQLFPDLDGDGDAEVVRSVGDAIWLADLEGPGAFEKLPVQDWVRAITAGDLDGDGRDELYAGFENPWGHGSVRTLFRADGGFEATEIGWTQDVPHRMQVVDADEDGRPELLVAALGISAFGAEDGGWTQRGYGGLPSDPCFLPTDWSPSPPLPVFVDIDGDGAKEWWAHTRAWTLFPGDGSPGYCYARGVGGGGRFADLDADGFLDLIAPGGGFARGDRGGTLRETEPLPETPSGRVLDAFDVDGDGRADVIAHDAALGVLTVYLRDAAGVLHGLPPISTPELPGLSAARLGPGSERVLMLSANETTGVHRLRCPGP